jgi:hypothetical protein
LHRAQRAHGAFRRDRTEFTNYVKSESAKWSKVIADRGLKLN